MQGVFQRTLWYPPKSDTPTIPGRTAMIVTNQVHRCRDCSSEHIVRNGRNRCRSQQYLCHECGGAARFPPKRGAQGRGRLPGGGSGCRGLTASAAASATSGRHTRTSSRREPTAVSAGRPGRPRTWNAGTTPGRFPRKTLSFSKKDWWHDQVTHLVHRRVQPLMLRVARIGA